MLTRVEAAESSEEVPNTRHRELGGREIERCRVPRDIIVLR